MSIDGRNNIYAEVTINSSGLILRRFEITELNPLERDAIFKYLYNVYSDDNNEDKFIFNEVECFSVLKPIESKEGES